jgi:cytochrome P450
VTVDTVCPSVFDAGLPALDYDLTTTPAQLYPRLLAAQQQAPIALGPFGPEVVSHELVRTVLRDSRFQIPPGLSLALHGITSGPLWDKIVNSLLGMEGRQHQRVRSVVSKAFTPRAIERLHATIVDVINDIVEPISRQGHCDVVTDIARPYPVPVICALLGAPREDWQQFALWADDVFKAFGFNFDPHDMPEIMRLGRARRLRRRHGGPSASQPDRRPTLRPHPRRGRRRPTHRRRAADDGRRPAAGGYRHHPQPGRRLHRRPPRSPRPMEAIAGKPDLAMSAVNETMRHSPTAGATMRAAAEDVELAGVVIPAGTMVITNTAAANRDPAIYDDPNGFDITREGAPPILTFGAGVHYCLGANLARLEIAEALRAVTRRMSKPRRTGPAPWNPLAALSGPASLPIAFDT